MQMVFIGLLLFKAVKIIVQRSDFSLFLRMHAYTDRRLSAGGRFQHCYSSTSSSFDDDCEILGSREVRQVYLVTYSQADLSKFPTRTSFAEAIVKSFTTTTASVLHWCCSKEPHKRSGCHYHISVKLSNVKHWLPSKRYLLNHFGVSVHFSSSHSNYYTAWKYVTKTDAEYEQSEGHPDLSNMIPPCTSQVHEIMQAR